MLATNEIVNMLTSKDTWTGQINHASITGQMDRTNKANLHHRTQRQDKWKMCPLTVIHDKR